MEFTKNFLKRGPAKDSGGRKFFSGVQGQNAERESRGTKSPLKKAEAKSGISVEFLTLCCRKCKIYFGEAELEQYFCTYIQFENNLKMYLGLNPISPLPSGYASERTRVCLSVNRVNLLISSQSIKYSTLHMNSSPAPSRWHLQSSSQSTIAYHLLLLRLLLILLLKLFKK